MSEETIPTNFEDFPPFVETCDFQNWRIKGKQHIDSGGFGDVFRACQGNDCKYVAKIIHYTPSHFDALQREKNDMYMLGNMGLSPRLHRAILCNKKEELYQGIDDFNDAKSVFEDRSKEEEEENSELFKSPNYAVLFSDFIQSFKPKDMKKRDYIKKLDLPVTKLLDQLWKMGLAPDTATPGNILPYLDPLSKEWKVKLVDVGDIRHYDSPNFLSKEEQESQIEIALDAIADLFD